MTKRRIKSHQASLFSRKKKTPLNLNWNLRKKCFYFQDVTACFSLVLLPGHRGPTQKTGKLSWKTMTKNNDGNKLNCWFISLQHWNKGVIYCPVITLSEGVQYYLVSVIFFGQRLQAILGNHHAVLKFHGIFESLHNNNRTLRREFNGNKRDPKRSKWKQINYSIPFGFGVAYQTRDRMGFRL